jgi:RNA polymerase sigma-70 factor (ECF subfamily)
VSKIPYAEKPSEIIKEWVDQHFDSLLSWACHVTADKETAQDLVQDTFLSALRSFNTFQGKSGPGTWLFSILNNKITDYYRKKAKSPIISENNLVKSDSKNANNRIGEFFIQSCSRQTKAISEYWETGEVHLLDDKEFQMVLEKCIQKLPPSIKAVVQLKYIDGMESRQICGQLDISPSNYWQMVHRAKLQLRSCMNQNWLDK